MTAVTAAAVVRAGERSKVGIRSSPGLPPANGADTGSVENSSTGTAGGPFWSVAVDCARPPPSPRLPLPVVAAADGRDRLFPPCLVNIAAPVAATSRHATTRRSCRPEQARHPDPPAAEATSRSCRRRLWLPLNDATRASRACPSRKGGCPPSPTRRPAAAPPHTPMATRKCGQRGLTPLTTPLHRLDVQTLRLCRGRRTVTW